MPPVPIENYGMQSHDDIGQTKDLEAAMSETEKTTRNIAAEIAALLEETPDYDEDVPDAGDDHQLSAPLAPVRHKRRSKTSSEEEERARRSSCFLTEIEDQEEEEEEESVQIKQSIVDFYLKKQNSVEEKEIEPEVQTNAEKDEEEKKDIHDEEDTDVEEDKIDDEEI